MKYFAHLSFLPTFIRYLKGIQALSLVRNWPIALRHIFQLEAPNALIEYQLVNGLKLSTYGSKRNRTVFLSIYEILIKNIYPVKSLDLGVVIDLGAQIGVFSLLVAHNRQSRIYAFEPEPENFRTLETNIAKNGFESHIFPKQVCVGEGRGVTEFYIDGSSSRSGGRFKGGHHSTEVINVETITLSDIVAEISEDKIDLVKVDIEGSEYSVFYSSPLSVLKKINRIYMECHVVNDSPPNYTLKHMQAFLEQAGFHVEVSLNEPILYATQRD